ncbi:MAG TPA: ABC transporter ATP-binding protein [Pyrinomonadaceae bacterium]|nr:ABC transporter ATP-binding protein [Pyrinomonadaceae bacterium]
MFELKNITKSFGGRTLANDSVSISIKRGTIHAIVGENGAGKTTAMRIAYGFYTADSGEILLDGRRVEIKNPHDAIALGIGMVHQHFMLVENMTVLENIVLGAESTTGIKLDYARARDKILRLSAELKLEVNPDALVENLSVGQRQRVEVLKALYRDVDILILDEPTAVLSPQEVVDFFAVLRLIKNQGKTIVLITHKLEEVLAISDTVTVMRDGRTVETLETAKTDSKELARLIVGRDVLLRVEKAKSNPGKTVLEVNDLVVDSEHSSGLRNITFNIREGEIVGIAGIDGNGQTELIEALAGLLPIKSGSIKINGKSAAGLNAKEIRQLGVAHIPEDRHKRGLLLGWSLAENSILGQQQDRQFAKAVGLMSDEAINKHSRKIIEKYDVRPADVFYTAKSLSGGNQQKLIIGREFETGPKLLLVSQPTRGVDIGAIEFIHRKLIEMRDKGAAILLISAELEEVLALSDRLFVINSGRLIAELDPAEATAEEIGLLMTKS